MTPAASAPVAGWADSVARELVRRLGPAGSRPPEGAYDEDLVRALLPLALPLYRWYWRVDVYGVENIPDHGPGLLASNHSGTIPVDGAMLKVAVLREHGRNPWLLASDLALRIPGLRGLIRACGNARADRDETLALLRRGELVGVFPEGFKGIGKGWKNRYRVQRFGRGGFVEMALLTGAPIVPVAIVGAEEAYPMLADASVLARPLRLPYFPITPTWPLLGPLGAIPLPSKWIIAFGEPVETRALGPAAAEDTQTVLEMTEDVRARVQSLLDTYRLQRRNAFC